MNMEGHIRDQEQHLSLGGGSETGWEDTSFATECTIQFRVSKIYCPNF